MSDDPVIRIPAELEQEDRIAGPVTFRMAGWLSVAGAGLMLVAFHGSAGGALGALLGVVMMLGGVAGACWRPAGQPVAAWLLPLVQYRRRHREYRRSAQSAVDAGRTVDPIASAPMPLATPDELRRVEELVEAREEEPLRESHADLAQHGTVPERARSRSRLVWTAAAVVALCAVLAVAGVMGLVREVTPGSDRPMAGGTPSPTGTSGPSRSGLVGEDPVSLVPSFGEQREGTVAPGAAVPEPHPPGPTGGGGHTVPPPTDVGFVSEDQWLLWWLMAAGGGCEC